MRWSLALSLALAWALTGWTATAAVSTRGAAFPSFFVDPYGQFSVVYLPQWGTADLGLRRSDRLVSVESVAVAEPPRWDRLPASQLREAAETARRSGASRLEVTFARDGAPRRVSSPLRTLGALEIWIFFVVNALVAWGLLLSGTWVAYASRRRGKWAYLGWSIAGFAFLITFYDFHSTRWFAPIFSLSTVAVPLGFLWLAFAFPEPAARPAIAVIPWCFSALAVLAAAALLGGPLIGADVSGLRSALDLGVPLSAGALAISICLRWARSRGRERTELRSSVTGLLLMPAFLAGGTLINVITGTDVLHLLMPFAVLLIPVSIGNALLKANIFAIRGPLDSRLLLVPVGLGVVIAAGTTAAVLALVSPSTSIAWAAAAGAFLLVGGVGWTTGARIAFPTRTWFRPAVERLGAQLATLEDAQLLGEAIEGAVARSISSTPVRLLGRAELQELPELDPRGLERLEAGERVWLNSDPWQAQLLLPMASLGSMRAVLRVGPRRGGALFTEDEVAHLETIANLGAVAIHHAHVLTEVKALRRLQEVVARDDKRFALATIAAELSHEIAYPVNYFRHLLGRASGGEPLGEEEVTCGRDELARLERMLAAFRGMRWPTPSTSVVPLALAVRRAADLLGEPVRERRIQLGVEIPITVSVRADPDALVQIFANLLRNAIDASEQGGEVGVVARAEAEWVSVTVWDGGPGVSPALEDRLFTPWATTKPGGSGLGLAVTHRLVRSFGGNIVYRRQQGRTLFELRLKVGVVDEPAAGAA